ncbi:MAG: head-tail connector protein [Alphaproteobacteria bacterium]|nr:head-tail connector protein [Alphaproteobacteria bacterium]
MSDVQHIYAKYKKALNKRSAWDSTWEECYEFALPQRESAFAQSSSKINQLFDGTAPDCVDQLAALMLSEMTPPWGKWFKLTAGTDLSQEDASSISPTLEKISDTIQAHFDRSNFALEIHQCYLDLITTGTACLLFEEAPLGYTSAFRFLCVPLSEICLDEGPSGRLDCTFRKSQMDYLTLKNRFPNFELNDKAVRALTEDEAKISIIESVLPRIGGGYTYSVFLEPDNQHDSLKGVNSLLKESVFSTSPFISFRWVKAPGEVYGRSPVMKALPDIKTANKVVELILKNASIAVTGIWLAEDDGVLNPANIKLTPGAIIPKAVGSKGLTPLEAPGKFDVSQLVIEDLRSHIRHALLGDKLGQLDQERMTATEVRERSAQMMRILGATYGRLQTELLMPLVDRAAALLRRRGEIPDIYVDNHLLKVAYKSTRANEQAQIDAENALTWFNTITKMGDIALQNINIPLFVKWLGDKLNVPSDILQISYKNDDNSSNNIIDLSNYIGTKS